MQACGGVGRRKRGGKRVVKGMEEWMGTRRRPSLGDIIRIMF